MSCNCIRIGLVNIPSSIPAHYLDANGAFWFDLPGASSGERYSKTKTASQLTVLNKISTSAVRNFALPSTDKNATVLSPYLSVSATTFNNTELIEVVVFEGSIVSPKDRIRVLGFNYESNDFEIELTDVVEFWKTKIEAVNLCGLEYGEFDSSGTGVNDMWTDNARFDDGDVGFYMPLVHFGNWFEPATYDSAGALLTYTRVTFADLRPHFHILEMLRKAFCAIGYQFICPFLETDYGRRLLAYVGVDVFGGPDKLRAFGFRASFESADVFPIVAASTELMTEDDFTAPNYDGGIVSNGGYFHYVPAGSIMANGDTNYYFADGFEGTFAFRANFKYRIDAPIAGFIRFRITIWDTLDPGPLTSRLAQYVVELPLNPIGDYTAQVVSEKFKMLSTYRVVVTVFTSAFPGNFSILRGSSFEALPYTIKAESGSKIRLSNYIDCDYDALDLLGGISHAIDGRIIEDSVTKKLYLFSAKSSTMANGEVVEGFYKAPSEAIDITDIILKKSGKIKINQQVQNRYYSLGFKDSTDFYIQSLGFTSDNPANAKLLDLGANKGYIENETTYNRNPFFEPTLNIQAPEIRLATPKTELPVEIPAYWNNNDRELKSGDIAPRIVYAFGYFGQLGEVTNRVWDFESSVLSSVPFVFQLTSVAMDNLNESPEQVIIYGTSEFDLYTLCWQDDLTELLQSLGVEYLAMIDNCFYVETQFRDLYRITYEGKPGLYRMVRISDFRPCDTLSTPIEFIPVKNLC